MVGVLTNVGFVVPAATALAAAGMGHFNQSLLIVLTGQELCPWFSANLELRDQQPIAQAINFSITVLIEPLQSGLEFRAVGF